MGPPPVRKCCCNLLMATMCLALLLGALTDSFPRCLATPSSSSSGAGTGAGGGAVATCSTTGGAVTNFSASGGSVASCYAYATTSPPAAPQPRAPSSSPSSSGYLSVLIAIWVSVLTLIPILADLRLV